MKRLLVYLLLVTSLLFGTDFIKAKQHVISKGESVSKISEIYGVSWSSIYHLNERSLGNNPNKIFPGDEVLIPIGVMQEPIYYYKLEIRVLLLLMVVFIAAFWFKKNTNTPVVVSSATRPGKESVQLRDPSKVDIRKYSPPKHIDIKKGSNPYIDKATTSSMDVKTEKSRVDMKKALNDLKKMKGK